MQGCLSKSCGSQISQERVLQEPIWQEDAMDRRTVLGLGLGAAVIGLTRPVFADEMNAAGALASDPTEIVPLWPKTPPGGKGVHLAAKIVERSTDTNAFHDRYVDNVDKPLLTVFRPAKPDGSAILMAPGGGYVREVLDKEGFETARRFNEAGMTVFVLRYRLPAEGWADGKDVPLQDAQRAMRLIRMNAGQYGIDPDRLGVIGFSAGGHVAASLATRFDAVVYKPRDKADALDAKPAYACLMYPVITMNDGRHKGSRDSLIGAEAPAELADAYSCDKLASAKTPPCFIALAADDTTVPPLANGVAMFAALRAAGVPAELHVFEAGGHGFGIRLAGAKPCGAWPDLFLAWARSHGFSGRAS
jgi:acetyl esterase/lipase